MVGPSDEGIWRDACPVSNLCHLESVPPHDPTHDTPTPEPARAHVDLSVARTSSGGDLRAPADQKPGAPRPSVSRDRGPARGARASSQSGVTVVATLPPAMDHLGVDAGWRTGRLPVLSAASEAAR